MMNLEELITTIKKNNKGKKRKKLFCKVTCNECDNRIICDEYFNHLYCIDNKFIKVPRQPCKLFRYPKKAE